MTVTSTAKKMTTAKIKSGTDSSFKHAGNFHGLILNAGNEIGLVQQGGKTLFDGIVIANSTDSSGAEFIIVKIGKNAQTTPVGKWPDRTVQVKRRTSQTKLTSERIYHLILTLFGQDHLGNIAKAQPAETKHSDVQINDFLTRLDQQATTARLKHVENGTLIKAAECWERLNITRQALNKALKDSRIFTVDGPSGAQLYPAFFTDSRYNRRDLEHVSKVLGDMPGPSKWQFFTTRKGSLNGKTPLEALLSGNLDKVLVAAAGFRDR